MKFEDLLMQRGDEQQKRLDLEEEVKRLQAELDGEQALNRVLRFALQGPVTSHPSLSSVVPPEVQLILEELGIVQEEIIWLERKVEELKLNLDQEREHNREREMQHLTRLTEENQLLLGPEKPSVLNDHRSRSQNYDEFRKEKMRKERRPSLGSVSEILSMSSTKFNGKLKIFPKKNAHKPPTYTRDKESE